MYLKKSVLKSCLCTCKFENEMNKDRLDHMYIIMNKVVKHLSNKQKDKDYLLMMEDFYKKFYERCDICRCREYSDNLIALSRLLQNNIKNIKFKKFRKSPIHNDNLITNFLYNICYDGVNQIHYPIYLINSIIYIFKATSFYHCFNKFDCITDNNKIAKTTFYTLNTLGTELITYDKPLDTDDLRLILTYSFQYPHDKQKILTEYSVSKLIYYNTDYLYSGFYYNDNCYLYRIRVQKIYILSNDLLPFKDVSCLLFYQDKLLRELFKNNNLLLELKVQIINVYKDGNKYVKKFDYNKVKKEHHKHILLDDAINQLSNEYYIVNKDGIDLFDKTLLTDTELNELFNPKTETTVEETASNSVVCNGDICNKVKDIIEYSSDDNSDEDLNVDHSVNDEPHSINNETENVYEPQYVFSYNKFIEFTDYDKDIIETSIYNKLRENDKMKLLFKPYNTINIIKNINKSYSKQNYFNVILFNDNSKTISNQYHIYLDNDNNITSITEITNLI